MFDSKTRKKFREKVRVQKDGCWVWTGLRHPKGYGQFNAAGQSKYAHRYFYEFLNGHVPEGFELHHVCRNKSCVRPDHLECVTHGENIRKAAEAGVWNGERNGNARRTNTEVMVVKALSAMGIPATIIAEHLNIPLRSVYAIVSEGVWKHVQLPKGKPRASGPKGKKGGSEVK
jgi:hypothetical protein